MSTVIAPVPAVTQNYFQKALEKFSSFFSSTWTDNFPIPPSGGKDRTIPADAVKEKFISDLNKLADDIFENINYSILSGEYICDDSFLNRIIEFSKQIKSIQPPLNSNGELTNFIQQNVSTIFVEGLSHGLNLYSDLINSAKKRLTSNNSEFLYSQESLIFSSAIESYEVNIKALEKNIAVAKLDLFADPKKKDLESIQVLLNEINSINLPYTKLISHKCKFLYGKIALAIVYDEIEKKPNKSFYYQKADYKEVKISISDVKEANPIYQDFLIYLEEYYQKTEAENDWKSKIEIRVNSLLKKKINSLTITELQYLIKYYKDINRNYEKLKTIRTEIKNRLIQAKEKQKCEFDIYVISVALNYAINNEFSCLCQLSTSNNSVLKDFEKLNASYTEVVEMQKEIRIFNFFPQHKFITVLTNELKELYQSKLVLKNIEICRKIIDRCKELFETYRESVDWTEMNHSYKFQRPFIDCCIDPKDDNKELNQIFIASSFVLPLVKESFVNSFSEFRKEIQYYENSLLVLENINSEVRGFKKQKEKLKKTEVRSMEILGIFTAIVTFVAGSLSTFKFIETAFQAAMFTLSFSFSLGLFVILMLLATRSRKEVAKYWYVPVIVAVIGALAWTLLIIYANDLNLKSSSGETQTVNTNKVELRIPAGTSVDSETITDTIPKDSTGQK